MIGSTGRYTRVSIRGSFTSDSNSGSSTTSESGSSIMSGSTRTGGSGSGSSTTSDSGLSKLLALCNLLQMNKEGVECTKYEKDLLRQTNIDGQYDCFFPNNKLFQPVLFGHNDTSV